MGHRKKGYGVGHQGLGTFKGGEIKHSVRFSSVCNVPAVCAGMYVSSLHCTRSFLDRF